MSVINTIKEKFNTKIEIVQKNKRDHFASIAPSDAKEIVSYLFKIMNARLMTITSVDSRAGIELIYHMAFNNDGIVLSVKTLVEKPALIIDSVTSEILGAEWAEREIMETMGVTFKGHPNPKKLLMSDDWPDGDYPLRKKTFESQTEGLNK